MRHPLRAHLHLGHPSSRSNEGAAASGPPSGGTGAERPRPRPLPRPRPVALAGGGFAPRPRPRPRPRLLTHGSSAMVEAAVGDALLLDFAFALALAFGVGSFCFATLLDFAFALAFALGFGGCFSVFLLRRPRLAGRRSARILFWSCAVTVKGTYTHAAGVTPKQYYAESNPIKTTQPQQDNVVEDLQIALGGFRSKPSSPRTSVSALRDTSRFAAPQSHAWVSLAVAFDNSQIY